MATITSQLVLSFIQSKIAETHAASGDIVSLLENPEVAFCLKVLDGKQVSTEQAPNNKATEKNRNMGRIS